MTVGAARLFAAVVLVAAVGAPGAASGSSTSTSPAADPTVPPGATPPVEVAITDEGFVPGEVTVPAGATVRWTNRASQGHTVTSEAFSSGALAEGETYSVTFDDPGTALVRDAALPDGPAGTVVSGDGVPPPPEPRRIIQVPEDEPTIQRAVNDATPGTLVLVADGVYRESVTVGGNQRAGLTIRGESRNGTVLDGDGETANGIFVNRVPDVTVEDVTIRAYDRNGLFFSFSDRFVGDRVKSIDNEVYGIYSFHAIDGVFRNSYATGSGDGGFYVGECADCRVVIDNVLAERNVLGYTGTNAGTVTIRNSEFRENAIGIVPNNLPLLEEDAPPRNGTIVGNWIHDNNEWDLPRKGFPTTFNFPTGNGIWVAGGWGFRIEGNLIERHDRHGIVLSWLAMTAQDNEIRGNVVRDGAKGDLAYDGLGTGNCFADNDFETSSPPLIEVLYPCDLPTTVGVPYPLIDADIYYGVARNLACTGSLDEICPRDIEYPPGPGDPP